MLLMTLFEDRTNPCHWRISWGILMFLGLCWLPQPAAVANPAIEETRVLGSRIKRESQTATATPLVSFGQSHFDNSGAKDIRDLIELLPINAGAQNNADIYSQNFTVGTSNINLRGLGVSSTLVLLNGQRQVLSAAQTDTGASFVDTAALVPRLAIQEVEILKDGASAIYGSDAVAGVVNFKTRNDFKGAEVQVERRHRTTNGSQDDTNVDIVLGGDTERGHFLLAASLLDRTSLVGDEVDWMIPADNTSAFGNPGSFIISPTETVPDPDCEANGGLLQTVEKGRVCRFNFGPQQTFVPEEERLLGYARADWTWAGGTAFWAEIGYAKNRADRSTSPSYPTLSTPTIPTHNPANTFGEDVLFQGRPYANHQSPENNSFRHDTVRLSAGIMGSLSDRLSLDWQLSYVTAKNDAILNLRDTIKDNFQDALDGLGGTGCTGGVAGMNGCKYFNVTADPGDPEFNDPELRAFIIGDYIGDLESTLETYELVVTGQELFHIGGRPVGFALGAQYRDESLTAVYDSITRLDGWTFLIGNPTFDVDGDVYAVFGEMLLPLSEQFEMDIALRHEEYGGKLGSTTDPKLSLLWRAAPGLSLRASASSAFRTPTPLQTQGVQTRFVNIEDPVSKSKTFAGDRTVGNEDLTPETSTTWNVGLLWEMDDHWNLVLDYWRFSFEDVLTKTSAQAIVNANPRDPRVERTAADTISIVRTSFVNANSIDTSGIDLALKGRYETDMGNWAIDLDVTGVLEYELKDEGGNTIDGAGQLNFSNFGDPMPEWRANLGLGWQSGDHAARVFLRHVSSYDNEQMDESIDHFTTVDVQYSFDLGDRLADDTDTSITLGIVNIADENPPLVHINGNYDPKTADPRGRRAYLRVTVGF